MKEVKAVRHEDEQCHVITYDGFCSRAAVTHHEFITYFASAYGIWRWETVPLDIKEILTERRPISIFVSANMPLWTNVSGRL